MTHVFANVHIAVEGAFLHVAPAPSVRGEERDVYIVPAAMVRSITYREKPRSNRVHGF
ncbi:hypothetical protein ABT282_34045 [Streptomyces sp. NPDC000927]|uniref:hypothetical protein n=1 Tax=Streptomyces sp. NPDC000927 TaxID=3154371 RepID=UPI00331BBD62